MVYMKNVFSTSKPQKIIAAFKITNKDCFHIPPMADNTLPHHQSGWFQIFKHGMSMFCGTSKQKNITPCHGIEKRDCPAIYHLII
jgi:hypothetical protein